MKKFFYTMAVIAIFAIGFAASGDDEEVRYDRWGEKYYKKTVKCAKCDITVVYWEAESGNSIDKPDRWYKGEYYCPFHYPD